MKYLFVLLFVTIIAACNKNKDNDSWKTVETFTFSNNKRIDTVRNPVYHLFVQVNPGSNIVFKYSHDEIAPPNIMDGGLSQDLYFEIPAGTTNFTYTDAALANASCFFQSMCGECIHIDPKPVTIGTIQGVQKSATTWAVNVDVLIPGTTTRITFQKDFKLSN